MKMLAPIRRFFPFLVIAIAYAWALTVVGQRILSHRASNTIDIRIAHWQLEAGVREGIEAAAEAYRQHHPNVRIIQEAIPESGYSQWLSVQLLSGTAPDIVEMGNLPPNLMTMFYQRYITPLTPYVAQPNPYNVGTALEGVPLINTFQDGLRQSFIDEIQEYMTIPLSRMGIRLFYNKTLLQKLTGLDEAPGNYRDFIAACEVIRSQKQPNGTSYVPISGSRYHLNGWNLSIFLPVTYGAFREFDFNLDGRVGGDEWALAFMSGRLSFDHPSYRGTYELVREITRQFQGGWIGLTRDEAVFNFAQQKAVFISSGLWEAGGLEQLAAGEFEIGIIDFPLPSSSDPTYGHLIEGPRYENPGGSVPFSITKNSQHPEVALDFLLFLASQKQNEVFNARLNWLPIVVGAESKPELAVFEPTLQGVFPAFFPMLGGESAIRWPQLEALFLVDQLDYDSLAEQYQQFYDTRGRHDFSEFLLNMLRGQARHAQLAAAMRTRALLGDENDWARYRNVALRVATTETKFHGSKQLYQNPEEARTRPLYQYSPEAWQRLQELHGPKK